jgi:hypothetical protein
MTLGPLAVSALVSAALAGTPDPDPPPASWPELELHLERAPAPSLAALSLEAAPPSQETSPTGAAPIPPGADAARRASLQFWGRTLRWSTTASLVVTSTLGTMAAINQPTAFGDGRCFTPGASPVLGDYGCNRGLSTLHGSFGVLSVTLYTANGVLRLAAPDSRGLVAEPLRPLHTVLGWVHLTGIIVQPILGLVAAYPQVIGKSSTLPTDSFPRNLRTIHLFIGYATTLAFLTTTILEE